MITFKEYVERVRNEGMVGNAINAVKGMFKSPIQGQASPVQPGQGQPGPQGQPNQQQPGQQNNQVALTDLRSISNLYDPFAKALDGLKDPNVKKAMDDAYMKFVKVWRDLFDQYRRTP